MGTPEFAVESLKAILGAGFPLKAVVTAPDKPSGRGLQMHASPVKQYAMQHDLLVLQPLKLKDPEFLKQLRSLKADIQVVVAFRMLPEEVWSMPRLGTFNLHASLLPQYRGAAPINWAIINGEKTTGVTTFFINKEIDKGSLIFREETGIAPNETAGELHDRLMIMGSSLVVRTIKAIASGKVETTDQARFEEQGQLKIAPKIFKNDCRINWEHDVATLYNFIRGMSPYPGAWAMLETNKGDVIVVKIYYTEMIREAQPFTPGHIKTDGRNFIRVAAGNGFMDIKSLQLEGKKRLDTADFLRGFPRLSECRFR
jgi:methionyl-tRNA formyltransferase